MNRQAAMQIEAVKELAPKRRFPPYPEYRDSGVEWLGMVPTHWQTDRLKWTVTMCRNGIWGNDPDGVNDVACVRVADFDRTRFVVRLEEPTFRAVTVSQRNGRLLSKGDLLLEKSGGGDLQPVGVVVFFDQNLEAVCSNFVARTPVATGLDGRFLAYFHAHLYSGRVNTRSIKQTTGIQNLDSDSYLNEHVPYIPLPEQQAIAAFLNRETARIDELVAKKQRLIELLAEKRSAFIDSAVTRSLNPKSPMKPSQFAWLANVPAHWKVRAFRYSARIPNGQVDPELPRFCDLPLVAPNHIESKTGRLLGMETAAEQAAESGKYLFESGAILYSKIRPALAKVCIAPVRGLCSADMYPINPVPDLRPKFLMYFMLSRTFTSAVILMSDRVAMPKINRRDLGAFPILVPPLPEQDEIIEAIEHETAWMDALTEREESAIQTLQEYRSALISAAVTGKIDVRGFKHKEAPCQ